jgi:tetratricopeptide (TPR) repeat protein
LTAEFADVPVYRSDLAKTQNNLGRLLRPLKELGEAEQACRAAIALQSELVAEFPQILEYRHDLSRHFNNLGLVLADADRAPEAEEAYRQAVNLVTTLAKEFPDLADYSSEWGGILNNWARILLKRDQLAQARQVLEEAICRQQIALQVHPHHPTYRLFLRNHYSILTRTLMRLGAHAEAARTAEQLPRVFPDQWEEYHRAAGYLAQCVALTDSPAQKEAYADRAMQLLHTAVVKGYRPGANLTTDARFAVLRSRPDFQQLVTTLETPLKPLPSAEPPSGR